MSAEENKRVVNRFVQEILTAGKLELVDELLAPNYSNPSVGATSREAFKGVLSGLKQAVPTRNFAVEGSIAEGDSVVIWGRMTFTLSDGKKVPMRLLTRYRLANGKIVEDEPFSNPPMMDVLGPMLAPKRGA